MQRVAPAWRSVRSKSRLVSRRRGASNSTVGARRRRGDAARGFLGGPGGMGDMGSPGSSFSSLSIFIYFCFLGNLPILPRDQVLKFTKLGNIKLSNKR